MSIYKDAKIWLKHTGKTVQGFKALPREYPPTYKQKSTSSKARDRPDRLRKQYLLWFPYGVMVRFDDVDLKFLPPKGYLMLMHKTNLATPRYSADANQHWVNLYNRFEIRRDRAPIKMMKRK